MRTVMLAKESKVFGRLYNENCLFKEAVGNGVFIFRVRNGCSVYGYFDVRIYRSGKEEGELSEREKLFKYFLEGISMVVALYEICRTGSKRKRKL